jgi:hypothetical protein
LCDTPDRIVLVDATTATVIARPAGVATTGAITGRSCTDPCGGPDGGWAGCSFQQTCTLTTSLAGARLITTGPPRETLALGVVQAVGDRAGALTACGPGPWSEDDAPLALCSTAKHTVALTASPDERDARLVLAVYPAGASLRDPDGVSLPSLTLRGALDPRASDATSSVYDFLAVGHRATLRLAATGSRVILDGADEACLAAARDR